MCSNAVWEGIAALLGMQHPSLYGFMGCFQKKPVSKTQVRLGMGSTNGPGGDRSTSPLPNLGVCAV